MECSDKLIKSVFIQSNDCNYKNSNKIHSC